MTKTVSIGKQDFASLREQNSFYIDKTDLIRAWWESQDDITLITRPRRFGKTLNMDMLNVFFQISMLTEEICLKVFLSGPKKNGGDCRARILYFS